MILFHPREACAGGVVPAPPQGVLSQLQWVSPSAVNATGSGAPPQQVNAFVPCRRSERGKEGFSWASGLFCSR